MVAGAPVTPVCGCAQISCLTPTGGASGPAATRDSRPEPEPEMVAGGRGGGGDGTICIRHVMTDTSFKLSGFVPSNHPRMT